MIWHGLIRSVLGFVFGLRLGISDSRLALLLSATQENAARVADSGTAFSGLQRVIDRGPVDVALALALFMLGPYQVMKLILKWLRISK